jgi:hypothetical protein
VSDIGILNDPVSLIEIVFLLGSPGLLLGAILGAALWRRHRIAGAVLGGGVGFVAWFTGWMMVKDAI